MLLVLPLLTWVGYKEVQTQLVEPEAVLVLGGSTKRLEREKFTAEFARKHPNLPILISGGSPKKTTESVFAKAGVDTKRLFFDYDAVDTVTNFTTIVDDLEKRGIKSVYLITSDYHMRRASVIGDIVLGSKGIVFKTISVPSDGKSESIGKTFRDGVRAILWVTIGYTGVDVHRMGNRG